MDDLEATITMLKASYADKISDKIQRLSTIEELIKNDTWNQELFDEIYQIVHKISGTSGILRMSNVSETGYNFESHLLSVKKSGSIDCNLSIILNFITAFKHALNEAFKEA